MSSYVVANKSKLSFKGDKKSKSKKKRKTKDENASPKIQEQLEGWIPVASQEDLEGPLMFLVFDEVPKAITICTSKSSYTETGQIMKEVQYLDLEPVGQYKENDKVFYEPAGIQQVFIGQKVNLGDLTSNKINLEELQDKSKRKEDHASNELEKYVLKTSRGTYLSNNTDGSISTDAVAISEKEMWIPIFKTSEEGPGSVCFMLGSENMLDKKNRSSQNPELSLEITDSMDALGSSRFEQSSRFLSINPKVIPKGIVKPVSKVSTVIHTGAQNIGFGEIFRVYCQAEIVNKRRAQELKNKLPESSGNLEEEEIEEIKKHQSWKYGKVNTEALSSKTLKKAKIEGKYHEEMLNRRSKLKSDKFCK
ncbi:hypothetical protein BB560_000444 [Smittium megazygosporum]|uniref:Protein FRG1 n=1 Tax=Smittium megazygosporum TaxID=133381 RepID=A0A2T9ZK91_9FUNG|nr:hypothetical protein BB560_000444 [Smittium megazygosporum]